VLKFKVKGGSTVPFKTYMCLSSRDGKEYYVFQLFWRALIPFAEVGMPASGVVSAQPAEAGLAQKQKLETALQLIRSVVLDFNNALTSILGHTSLILGKTEPHHPWRSSLLEVEKSAEKAAEIAHDLAAFSRQEKDARAVSAGNLNDLLQRTVELFQGRGTPSLHYSLQLENKLYTVYFDEAKMQQAFLKILDNAVQAVGTDGRITLRTRNLELAEPLRDGAATLAAGHYVCVDFSDNGCGISPEVLPRIFEPFFTTKPNHRGLGLAWVYGIVTNHGGSVAVSSVPNRGTTVRLYLPAVKRFVKDRSFRTDELSGTQTILVVDDEDLMLTMAQMVLSSFGYQVLIANSGEKALAIIGKPDAHIDLVITDMVMPGMSGRELVERLRQSSPHLKLICCSGFVRPSTEEEDEMYLQKPFTSQELLRKVKQVLTQMELT
jgi:signal transduction histidine kinase